MYMLWFKFFFGSNIFKPVSLVSEYDNELTSFQTNEKFEPQQIPGLVLKKRPMVPW